MPTDNQNQDPNAGQPGGDPNAGQPGGDPPKAPAWMSQLAGDLQGNEGLTQFKDISELGKAFIAASEKQAGSIKIPDENSSDEDREAYHKQMGRPDTAEGYELVLPDGTPESYNLDNDRLAGYKNVFHKIGLNNNQATQLLAASVAEETAAEASYLKTINDATTAAVEGLKTDWGDKYEANAAIAQKAAAEFGGQELIDLLDETVAGGSRLGDNVALTKMFFAIGSKIADPDFIGGQPAGEEREFGQMQYKTP